jgi:hypothetical protein
MWVMKILRKVTMDMIWTCNEKRVQRVKCLFKTCLPHTTLITPISEGGLILRVGN